MSFCCRDIELETIIYVSNFEFVFAKVGNLNNDLAPS